jgi:hypothetical protein
VGANTFSVVPKRSHVDRGSFVKTIVTCVRASRVHAPPGRSYSSALPNAFSRVRMRSWSSNSAPSSPHQGHISPSRAPHVQPCVRCLQGRPCPWCRASLREVRPRRPCYTNSRPQRTHCSTGGTRNACTPSCTEKWIPKLYSIASLSCNTHTR